MVSILLNPRTNCRMRTKMSAHLPEVLATAEPQPPSVALNLQAQGLHALDSMQTCRVIGLDFQLNPL